MTRTAAFVLSALIAAAAPATAQDYPSRAIKFIVPQNPGGTTDTLGRIFAAVMGKELGQEIVVENRTGAGSTVGMQIVADSEPDGYTIGVSSQSALTISPLVVPDVKYDPIKDFTPIYNFASVPIGLIVNVDLGPKTLKELVDYAKAHPGELNYSSAGAGTGSHFTGAMFAALAGISKDVVHIPYEGGGQASTAAAAGEVQFYVGPLAGNMMGVIDGKKVIALAVSGDKRVPALPDVPTFAEAGLPEYTTVSWYGLVAPAGTPKEAIDKLNAAANAAAKTPEAMKALEAEGVAPAENTPEQFAAQIAKDVETAKKLVGEGAVVLK
jgi:tripartite-type tricarboxylate transporter receptor subunit TctC